MLFAILIFDPNWPLCKVYSLCIVATFANFQNGHIFRILAFFWSPFLYNTTVMCFSALFRMLFGILIFDPNWPLCKGYSLCILAIFANFQNGLIFPVLAVFWSRFLHNTTVMCFYSSFSHVFRIFNFWPELTTLQRLWPLHSGHFCQFSKWSHFSNISFFLEPVFCIKQV